MTTNIQKVSTDIFRDAVALSVTFHRWGIERNADIRNVKIGMLSIPEVVTDFMKPEPVKSKSGGGLLVRNGVDADGSPVLILEDDEDGEEMPVQNEPEPTREIGEPKDDKAVKRLLALKKSLIVSPEYNKIVTHDGETYREIKRRCVPSFFKAGIDLVRVSSVERIEAYLQNREAERRELVKAFIEVYPIQQADAERILSPAGFYNASQYPTIVELNELFGMRWYWISFGVPNNLPAEIFAAESAKAKAAWQEAETQIVLCLRTGFQQVVDHLLNLLKFPDPGTNMKTPRLRDAAVENFRTWLVFFEGRDITNDRELAALVDKAKQIVGVATGKDIRTNETLRKSMTDSFAEIKDTVSGLIAESPKRVFDFGDEV